MTQRKRIDLLMVNKGLARSQKEAQALILAGRVVADDKRVDKPGALVSEGASLRLKKKLIFVSRGALKLKAAVEKWPANIKESICIDVGASTGGFTDFLLKKGAKKVYAVDVGYNQLAYSLRIDPRVHVMERTHILQLDARQLEDTPHIAVIDVSFISLKRVLPKVSELIDRTGTIYALIKPQFEVEKSEISEGGIVRDKEARLKAVGEIIEISKEIGLFCKGHIESPIAGTDGNIEYLAAFSKSEGR